MRYRTEQGSVLVLALLFALLILAIGLPFLALLSSGKKMSDNITRQQEALYAAESGIERALSILNKTSDWARLLEGCGTMMDNVKGNLLCEKKGGKDRPLLNVQLVHSSPLSSTVDKNPAWNRMVYTVWLRNDWTAECDTVETDITKADCNGDSTPDRIDKRIAQTDTNRRVIVRSEGKARDGIGYIAVDAIISGDLVLDTNKTERTTMDAVQSTHLSAKRKKMAPFTVRSQGIRSAKIEAWRQVP